MNLHALHNYEVIRKKDYFVLRRRDDGCPFGQRYGTREEAQAALDKIVKGT